MLLLVYCDELLIKNPKNIDAIRGKILALQKQGRLKEAQDFCENIIEMFPYDPKITSCIANLKQEFED